MRKSLIKFLICVLTLCGFCGILGINTVKAHTLPGEIGGVFELTGASVRNSTSEEDLSGIRFTTNLSQKAYKDILTFANGKTVLFGTEIVPANNEKAEPVSIQYLSTDPKSGESKPKFKTSDNNEVIEYHASMTYNLDDFTNDIENKLLVQGKLTKGEENYNIKLENYVLEYLKQAYGMQLKATSYFEIEYQRYYTGSIVRSMSMLANYYDKTPEYQKELTQYFYDKGYFTNGEPKTGYILQDGSITVDGFDMESVVAFSQGYDALEFVKENTLFNVKVNLPNLNESITVYAFDEDNKVTTLTLQYVNDLPLDITIGNNNIATYKIAVDENNEETYQGALELQSLISKKIGKNLEIVGLGTTENVIAIKQVNKNETAEEGFKAFVTNNNLTIECAYMNKFDIAFETFCASVFDREDAVVLEDGYIETVEISKVYYSDFGVIGDGVTNDFYAMKEAHDFANISGQTVYGEGGKTYYIKDTLDESGNVQVITIKTNVDWCNAKIVIDDTWLTPDTNQKNSPIFEIANDYKEFAITDKTAIKISDIVPNKKIPKDTTSLNNPYGYPLLLHIYNGDRKMFLRYGNPGGGSQNEIFYVDANGNLVDTTILFDFDNVTSIKVYRADTPSVTVKNAVIQSKASQYNLGSKSNTGVSRGIKVTRPNTVVRNLEHVITDEIPKGTVVDGVPYYGMSVSYFSISNAYNVLVEDCVFQSHVYYKSGTYDIGPGQSHTVIFKNCTQSNFFELKADGTLSNRCDTGTHWGIMGSNGCKNLVYDGCTLSRFDAHAGLVDGKIINSKVGKISVTGGGELLIENTEIYAYSHYVMVLRADYGAFWNGTIKIKDSHVVNAKLDDGKYRQQMTLICDADTVNHNFGYECQFPNFIIDNLKMDKYAASVAISYSNRALTDPSIFTLGALDLNLKSNEYVYNPPKFITVINNDANKYKIFVPSNNDFFTKATLTGVDVKQTDTKVTQKAEGDNTGFDLSWLVGATI